MERIVLKRNKEIEPYEPSDLSVLQLLKVRKSKNRIENFVTLLQLIPMVLVLVGVFDNWVNLTLAAIILINLLIVLIVVHYNITMNDIIKNDLVRQHREEDKTKLRICYDFIDKWNVGTSLFVIIVSTFMIIFPI